MKLKGVKIAMLTAYDSFMARLLDRPGLISSWLAILPPYVMAGYTSKLPITRDR
jgi:ketopantoate hydroxymethyltransferase